jgi:hypothetical protein
MKLFMLDKSKTFQTPNKKKDRELVIKLPPENVTLASDTFAITQEEIERFFAEP